MNDKWYSRPVLFVADIDRCVDFYVKQIGFTRARAPSRALSSAPVLGMVTEGAPHLRNGPETLRSAVPLCAVPPFCCPSVPGDWLPARPRVSVIGA